MALVLAAAMPLLAGCSDDEPLVRVGAAEAPAPAAPVYDPELESAASVMAVVPATAETLQVTDYDQVRLQLGFGDLSSDSPADELDRFWSQAERRAALLSTGMLRTPGGARYERRFGFTQDDVAWEAHFDGPDGEGYVVRFHDDVDMGAVGRAAARPTGPLTGAVVVPSASIVALGATREPTESWAADPALTALVGQKAGATLVDRACLPFEVAFGADVEDDLAPATAADLEGLDELGPFAVAFGGSLVTVQLGPLRPDVFARARLADTFPSTDPEFGLGYADPVADPQSGRIGYTLGDGPVAARLALQEQLPFAVCA